MDETGIPVIYSPSMTGVRAAVAAGVVLGLTALGACTSTDDAATGAADTDATGTPAATPGCQDPGFSPRTRVRVTSREPRAVYLSVYTLAPGSTVRAAATTLQRFDLVRLRVRTHDGAPVPADVRRAVLGRGAAVDAGRLPERYDVPLRLRNDTDRNQAYVVFAGGDVLTGRWTATTCAEGATAVTRLRGTFTTVGALRAGSQSCSAAPAQPVELSRRALRGCALG